MRAEGDSFTAELVRYTPDAWVNNAATEIGSEISFMRHFYTPQRLRLLAPIRADICAVVKLAEGLLESLPMTDTAP
jgi:type I restriction enzyme M protein